jgi:Selenoprotein SelK_SelG
VNKNCTSLVILSDNRSITMPYVSADGTVGGRKSILRSISDFFAAILDFIGLIFTSITNPPPRLENRGNYAQRNQGRTYRSGVNTSRNNGGGGTRSNIRGVKNLQGSCDAKMGGG